MMSTEIAADHQGSRHHTGGTGSQQTFETLYRQTWRQAYNRAYRLVGNASTAEDITQEAYVRAWRHFDRFDPGSSFRAWLFHILNNLALNWHRFHRRHPTSSLDAPRSHSENGDPLYLEIADTAGNPETIVLSGEMEERLESALKALPAKYRTALLLADVEEHSYQEIGVMLHWPLGTVRSRIHRARQRLRRTLEGDTNSVYSRLA